MFLDVQMLPILMLSAIVLGSLILFVWDKLPIDGVAFLVLLSLLLTGLVPSSNILDGFANPATMTVAVMFVLSAALQRTGIVRHLARYVYVFMGKSRAATRLNGVMGVTMGVLSAFINNTAMVSVFLPVTLRMCRERGISPTKVLMTLTFAAQFGGVCTLIGTSTNLLVNAYAVSAGYPSFGLFEFGKLGLICFVVGMLYMLVASRFLPERVPAEDAVTSFSLRDYVMEMEVQVGSPLIGQTGKDNMLNEVSEDLRILDIIRDGDNIWAPQNTKIQEGDILLIRGSVDRLLDAAGRLKLTDWAEGQLSEAHLQSDDVAMAEVMIPRGSKLIGKTLTQMDFYWRYHAAVLAVRRSGEAVHERLANIEFKEGDMLLLQGHKDDVNALADEQDFMLLNDLSVMVLKKKRAIYALGWLAFFLVTVGFGVLPVLTAALVAAAGVVFSRCLTLQEAYGAVNLPVVVLLAGLIPLGLAMQSTGTAAIIASTLLGTVHAMDSSSAPMLALVAVYVLTGVLTAVMSNTATAALLAPLGVGIAESLGVSSTPFLVAVAFAASTCFTTPVGYQTNMMVYVPGGYKYMDFIKIGLPLNVLLGVISILLIPYFWPF